MTNAREILARAEGGILRERFYAEKDAYIESALGQKDSWARAVAHGRQGVLLDDIPRLITALGLKIVDQGAVCVNPEIFAAYKALAKAAMNQTPEIEP